MCENPCKYSKTYEIYSKSGHPFRFGRQTILADSTFMNSKDQQTIY